MGSLNDPAPSAPSAFAVVGPKTYLYDTKRHAVRVYSAGKLVQRLSLPNISVRDLSVTSGALAALVDDNTVMTFALRGSKAVKTGSYKVQVPATSYGRVEHFTSDKGQVVAQAMGDARVPLAQAASKAATATNLGMKMLHDRFTATASGGQQLTMRVPYAPSGIDLLYRGEGFAYYEVWDEHATPSEGYVVNRYVFKYTEAGHLVSTYTLARSTTAAPQRSVLVANGSVYQMVMRKAVAQPHFLRAKKSLTVTGIPYTWGGYDSDSTRSPGNKWKNFDKGVAGKGFTGSVKNVGVHAAGTIGLDCSGFISAVFSVGKNKRGTANLLVGEYFKPVGGVAKAGDILNKTTNGSHVVLVVKRVKIGAKWYITLVEETTSTMDGKSGVDKTYKNKPLTTNELRSGFDVGRYVNWKKYQCGPGTGVQCPVSLGVAPQ